MSGRLLAAIAMASALGACSSSDPRPTPSVLLPDVGPGYHLADASGPLSKEALAVATALPKAVMSSYLTNAGWRSGGERVWTSTNDGFVTDIVATFAKDDDATYVLPSMRKRVLYTVLITALGLNLWIGAQIYFKSAQAAEKEK